MKKLLTFCFVALLVVITTPFAAHAQTPSGLDLHGWAWSWTTGWIKLSSKVIDSSGQPTSANDNNIQYGVTFDQSTGAGSGWAWSPNVGWISFNAADLAKAPFCAGPNGVAAKPAKLEVDGTTGGYKLTGTARAISPTQSSSGWDLLSAHGNWNGCIYLDQTSLPSNPCNVTFGVKFLPLSGFQNTFSGQGQAWNAAGALGGSTSCSSPIGFGGLSFIEFAGTFKSILKQLTPTLTATVTTSGWAPACKEVDPPYAPLTNKSVTGNYTVSVVAGTQCAWTLDGVQQGGWFAAAASGSKTFTGLTGSQLGITVGIKCYNPSSNKPLISDPYVATALPVTCAECSDWEDNNGVNGIDQSDIACHVKCDNTQPYTPEVSPEAGNQNCASGTKTKGIPVIKEN